MLLYLADKTGRFIPQDERGRAEELQWLLWQMGRMGPMAGQNQHFKSYAVEKIACAIGRQVNKIDRLHGVLNKRLADRECIAGVYSIADMAGYPRIAPHERQGRNLDAFPHLKR